MWAIKTISSQNLMSPITTLKIKFGNDFVPALGKGSLTTLSSYDGIDDIIK